MAGIGHKEHLAKRLPFPEVWRPCFTPDEVQWLEKYGAWLEALAIGEIEPETEAQQHFVSVARRDRAPSRSEESIWLRYATLKDNQQTLNILQRKLDSALYILECFDDKEILARCDWQQVAGLGHPRFLRACAEHLLRDAHFEPAIALRLAHDAADLGDGEAAHLLGIIFEYGFGVSRNLKVAHEWYKKASCRGIRDAETKLKNLVVPDDTKLPVVGSGNRISRPSGAGHEDWGNDFDDMGSVPWERYRGNSK